jgi:hypothetical protein
MTMAITTRAGYLVEEQVAAALPNVKGHFVEMPGLRLTAAGVARLCALDPVTCQAVLQRLLGARFLIHTEAGTLARAAEIDSGA